MYVNSTSYLPKKKVQLSKNIVKKKSNYSIHINKKWLQHYKDLVTGDSEQFKNTD